MLRPTVAAALAGVLLLISMPAVSASETAATTSNAAVTYGTTTNGGRIGYDTPASVVLLDLIDAAAPNGRCTGTVISARLVLTARHCVASSTFEAAKVSNQDGSVGSGRQVIHLGAGEVGADDIALLVLEQPTSVEPMPVANNFDRAQIGLEFQAYGSSPAGAERLHWVKSTIRDCAWDSHRTEGLVMCGLATGMKGDSGGPAAIVHEEITTLIAVSSFGEADQDRSGTGYADAGSKIDELIDELQLSPLYDPSMLSGFSTTDLGDIEFETPTCNGKPATIVGTDRGDELQGTSRSDVIVAGAGGDRIWALGGRDTICAGRGRDLIYGGRGNDFCNGGPGPDTASACERTARL